MQQSALRIVDSLRYLARPQEHLHTKRGEQLPKQRRQGYVRSFKVRERSQSLALSPYLQGAT